MKHNLFTIPNILSLFRICLIPLIVWLYLEEDEPLWAGYILILSGLTDIADGFIARRFHMVSDLGKILDPIADKLTQAVMLICLVSRFPGMLLPFFLMVVKELFMAVTGCMVIRRTGSVYSARWHGKAATLLLYAMMLLHLFWPGIPESLSLVSIFLCACLIVLSFALYGLQNLSALKEARHG